MGVSNFIDFGSILLIVFAELLELLQLVLLVELILSECTM